MTTTARYPSTDFPGVPALALDLPDGWSGVHAVGPLMVVRGPDSGSSVRSNVIIDAERIGPLADPETFLAELGLGLPESAEVVAREVIDHEVTPTLSVEVGVSSGGVKARQRHMFVYVPGEQVAHLVSLVATVAGDASEDDVTEVESVIRSFSVDLAGSGEGSER